jgi:hypothetical protein
MTRSKHSADPDVRIKNIRQLRQTADFLADNADQHRAVLIDRLGLKRYIFNALGSAAHRPANNAQLVWPDGTEQVEANGARLGDYLYARAQREHDLPRAVVVDGKKYHL